MTDLTTMNDIAGAVHHECMETGSAPSHKTHRMMMNRLSADFIRHVFGDDIAVYHFEDGGRPKHSGAVMYGIPILIDKTMPEDCFRLARFVK